MEIVKQLLLALGLMGSPVDHPPEPCLGNCKPSPAAVGVMVGHSVTAKPECRDVHGRLDSVAAELDGDSETLETVGTLRGGIHADFEFRSFTPVPTNVPLENV